MIIDLGPVGTGIVKDTQPHLLPPGVWSDGRNVRFADQAAHAAPGTSAALGTPGIAPHFLLPIGNQWVYAGLNKIYATDQTTHANITRQSGGVDVNYTATANTWTGGVLSGIAILNNGSDLPQYWPTASLSTKLADLANWPTNIKCASMRPFGNYLVALDLTIGGVRYPYRLRWSHPAEPGAVPASWDIADATKDAGEVDLGEGEDALIDCRGLSGQAIVYKERSTWAMRPVGGNLVFGFQRLFSESGLIGRLAHTGFGETHFVVTQDDIIAHNGVQILPLIQGRLRRWFFNAIHSQARNKIVVAHDPQAGEILVTVPQAGDGIARLAMVWHIRDNAWSIRELPGHAHLAFGPISPPQPTWDSLTQTWDSYTQIWDPFVPSRLVGANPGAIRFDALTGNTANGTAQVCRLERTGLLLDSPNLKQIIRVFPRIDIRPANQTVNLFLGTQGSPDDPVAWRGPFAIAPGQRKLDVRLTGRYIAVAIESRADVAWSLYGLSFEIIERGPR